MEVVITGVEEVAMLTPVEAVVALMPPIAERDELLLLKLPDTRDGKEEENEGPEAKDPLF